ATVGPADLEIWELVERTLENKMGERDRGLERVTDHVAERARALDALGDAGRLRRRLGMDEHERLQFLRLLPERVEPGARDLLACDIAADASTDQSELLHALLELLGGELRKLQRHRRVAHETAGERLAHLRHVDALHIEDAPREVTVGAIPEGIDAE